VYFFNLIGSLISDNQKRATRFNFFSSTQASAQLIFLIANPIQIHHKYGIGNPNQDSIFFQNALTIQSNHNPTIFGKRCRRVNIKWSSFMLKPLNSHEASIINLQPY